MCPYRQQLAQLGQRTLDLRARRGYAPLLVIRIARKRMHLGADRISGTHPHNTARSEHTCAYKLLRIVRVAVVAAVVGYARCGCMLHAAAVAVTIFGTRLLCALPMP